MNEGNDLEISPCPFCGGRASPDHGSNKTWVSCDNEECLVRGPSVYGHHTIEDRDRREWHAVERWNFRAESNQ